MTKSLFSKCLVLVLVVLTVLFVGCKSDPEIKDDATKITVAASPTPHAEILKICVPLMEEKGYTLEIKEFSDYVIPNTATEEGEVDANYFQHTPYLNDFNAENGTHLVSVGAVHYEPFGIYAGTTSDLSVKTGLKIAVPNDTTNEARALLLLEQEGFITLKEGAGLTATKVDIVEFNGNEIVELEAAAIAQARPDCNLVVLNGNYAIGAGLKVKDALAIESATGPAATTYANVLVVHECNAEKTIIKALLECLQSEEVKTYIQNTYEGSVVPMF